MMQFMPPMHTLTNRLFCTLKPIIHVHKVYQQKEVCPMKCII